MTVSDSSQPPFMTGGRSRFDEDLVQVNGQWMTEEEAKKWRARAKTMFESQASLPGGNGMK